MPENFLIQKSGHFQGFFRLKRAFSNPPLCAPTLCHPPTNDDDDDDLNSCSGPRLYAAVKINCKREKLTDALVENLRHAVGNIMSAAAEVDKQKFSTQMRAASPTTLISQADFTDRSQIVRQERVREPLSAPKSQRFRCDLRRSTLFCLHTHTQAL